MFTKKKIRQISIEALCFGLLMILIYVIFNTFLGIAVVRGQSMLPTLQNDSIVIIQKALLTPKPGDIVTISPYHYKNELIKRVVAVEGDVVDIDFKTGTITVNGKLLDESYILEPTTTEYDVKFPITVKQGCIFVLGDNRNNSIDSRSTSVGQIPVEYVDGIYLTTIKR